MLMSDRDLHWRSIDLGAFRLVVSLLLFKGRKLIIDSCKVFFSQRVLKYVLIWLIQLVFAQ